MNTSLSRVKRCRNSILVGTAPPTISLKREIFIRDVPFSSKHPCPDTGKRELGIPAAVLREHQCATRDIYICTGSFNARIVSWRPRITLCVVWLAGAIRSSKPRLASIHLEGANGRGSSFGINAPVYGNHRHGRVLFSDFAPIVRLRAQLPLSKERRAKAHCALPFLNHPEWHE